MRIFLAWHNTLQNKKRPFAAVAGITFAVPKQTEVRISGALAAQPR